MNTLKRYSALLICVALPVGVVRGAGTPSGDPLSERLFPPELILAHAEAIGLSGAQRKAVAEEVEKAQKRFQELEPLLQEERVALVAVLDREPLDDEAVRKQFNRLLARETDVRTAQLRVMLALRSQLTAEQRAKLKGLRGLNDTAGLEARLKAKVERVQNGMQRWSEQGRDPGPIATEMQRFPELMKAGEVKEAEALLDRVLKRVEEADIPK